MSDFEREAFEKYALEDGEERYMLEKDSDGTYKWAETNRDWNVWQAARSEGGEVEPAAWWDGDLKEMESAFWHEQTAWHTIPVFDRPPAPTQGVPELHCRIGSSEKLVPKTDWHRVLHCRIGANSRRARWINRNPKSRNH